MRLSILFFVIYSNVCKASALCDFVYATAIGSRGAVTAFLEPKTSRVNWIGDREPKITVDSERLPVWIQHRIQGFGVQPDNWKGSYVFVLEEDGVLRIVTPDRVAMSVLAPAEGYIQAAALYQAPLRANERTFLPADGLRADERASVQLPRQRRELHNQILMVEEATPTLLYVAVGNHVFRSVLKPVEVDRNTPLAHALLDGPTRVVRTQPAIGDLAARYRYERLPESIIDFSDTTEARVILPTARPDRAYEISPFERVVTIADEKVMKRISFLQVLSPDRIFLGSELGQMLIVAPNERRIVHQLAFETTGWLASASCHKVGDIYQVWAVNAGDKKIYRWTSADLNVNTLRPAELQLPDDEIPVSITTSAQPISFSTQSSRATSARSDLQVTSGGMVEQRVLAVARSGRVFAWVPKGAERNGLQDPSQTDYQWVRLFAPAQD